MPDQPAPAPRPRLPRNPGGKILKTRERADRAHNATSPAFRNTGVASDNDRICVVADELQGTTRRMTHVSLSAHR